MTQPKPAGYTDSFPSRNGDLTDQQAQVVADYMGGSSTWYQGAGANFSPPDDARIPLENFGLLPKSDYRSSAATDTVPATYGDLTDVQAFLVTSYIAAQSLDDLDTRLFSQWNDLDAETKDRILAENESSDPVFRAMFDVRNYSESVVRSAAWEALQSQALQYLRDPAKQAEPLSDEVLGILRWWRAIGTA